MVLHKLFSHGADSLVEGDAPSTSKYGERIIGQMMGSTTESSQGGQGTGNVEQCGRWTDFEDGSQ